MTSSRQSTGPNPTNPTSSGPPVGATVHQTSSQPTSQPTSQAASQPAGQPVNRPPMVDIHCHLIPGIDDGAQDLKQSVEMARMAVHDGIGVIVVTPHQLGNFKQNTGDIVRAETAKLQAELQRHGVPLRVLPGGDVRIEEQMIPMLLDGQVMTLGDHRRHVLLELPHELYFPLEPILQQLAKHQMVGILSHPERNQGLLRQRELLPQLVDAGCLMQVTAGSLVGGMGAACQELSQWMLGQGLVHFLATDAHGPVTRRPLLKRAYQEAARLTDEKTAYDLCVYHPGCVAVGRDVTPGRRPVLQSPKKRTSSWFGRKKAS